MHKPPAQPRPIGTTVLVLLALALAAAVLPAGALAAPEEGNGTLTASPLTLAPTTVNYQSATQAVQIGYEGEGEVSINKVSVEGEEAGEFYLGTSNCTTNLADGQLCEVGVGSKPSSIGEKHAWLTVVFNGLRPEEKFELSGRGVAPQLAIAPSSHDFGLARANRETLFETFQVTNSGEADVGFNYVDFEGPGENAFWTDNGGTTCWGAYLAPGQSCSLRVAFSPQERAAFTAEMHLFASNVAGVAGTATVSGEGGGAIVAATENPVAFGSASVGSLGSVRTITLENTGNMGEGFFIGVIAGGDAGSFQLLDEHCTMHELAPGQTCTAHVRFHPLAPGPLAAHLAFFGDGEGVLVQLEGEGVSGVGGIAPGSFDFGLQAAGTRSAPHAFVVSNVGSAAIDLDHVSIGGADIDQFVVAGDGCSGETLAPGGACQVRVRFAPDSAGAKQALLRVYGSAPTLVAPLSGTGTEVDTAASVGMGPVGHPLSGPAAGPPPFSKTPKRARHRRFGRNATISAPSFKFRR